MFTISANFESGNIGEWHAKGFRSLGFLAPLDGAPLAMWFYFRLEGAGPGPFDFVLENLLQCLESTHWGDVRPVMRLVGGEWQRARDEDVQLDLAAGEFRFRFELPSGPVEVAYTYPYPPSKVEQLLAFVKGFANVEVSFPGLSQEGRPVPYVIMRCIGPHPAPEILWTHCREHAGEVSGGQVFDGFLRALAASPLRQRFEIHAMPVIDIDAVAAGRYGKLAPPVDHHMCWTPDSPRPEVLLAMRLMRESVSTGRKFRLLVNFHSPSPENDSYLVPFNPSLLSQDKRLEADQIAASLQVHFPADFPFRVDEMSYQRVLPWWDDNTEHRPEAFVLNNFGALSVTIEIAYHASSNGTFTSPAKYHETGAGIVRALEEHYLNGNHARIGIYHSLPPVFLETHGWALWEMPWHTRLVFQPGRAWAVADDPSARVYFGIPTKLRPEEMVIWVNRSAGGQAQVKWLCYDETGTRLLEASPVQELQAASALIPLEIEVELPALTGYVRPSFLLQGPFRPFEIILSS